MRIEPLAKALGVTKGGFYGYFADRAQLLDEVLGAWEQRAVYDVIARIEAEGGDARPRLRRLSALAGEDAGDLLATDLAVRDWARRDPAVAAGLRRVDERRMAFMREQFAAFAPDPDVRALTLFSLWIGPHFIAADRRALGAALRRLLD